MVLVFLVLLLGFNQALTLKRDSDGSSLLMYVWVVLQCGSYTAAVGGWAPGCGSVLNGSDDDTGGSPSADEEDGPAGEFSDSFS